MIVAILFGGIGLGPDEAQYWTWSQLLDWGYYSKPPGIAWVIWLGTNLFGNTECGVRAMPLMLGFLMPIGVYVLGKQCKLKPSLCFWAALCLAVSPMGVLASFLSITDGGMILCWIAASAHLAGCIEKCKKPNYYAIAFWIALGALFKWTMFFFWLAVLGSWVLFRWMASWRQVWKLLRACAVSLAALFPSIYWNASHDWATFRHVSSTLQGGHAPPGWRGNPLEFLGAEAALVSPVLFFLLLFALIELVRSLYRVLPAMFTFSINLRSPLKMASAVLSSSEITKAIPLLKISTSGTSRLSEIQSVKVNKAIPPPILFCGILTLACLGGGFIASFYMKMQGNWVIFAYPTAFILLVWYASEGARKLWMVIGTAVSTVLVSFVFMIPVIQTHGWLAHIPIPYRISPFKHNVGWEHLAEVLTQVGYDPHNEFLFGDKYQTASILSFYGPNQKRAYFFNLGGARKNQFSYWPEMPQEQVGKSGYFVVVENVPQLNDPLLSKHYAEELRPYFRQVAYLGNHPLFEAYGKIVKGALLFKCEDYLGSSPSSVSIY